VVDLGTVVAVLVGLGVSGAGWPAPAPRVLRVAEATDVVTLDPAFAADRPSHSVIGHIYERLMRYEYDPRSGGIRPVPELLRRLEVSADGRTWTFWIQPGRVFSDGNPVDAVAVKSSLERNSCTCHRLAVSPAVVNLSSGSRWEGLTNSGSSPESRIPPSGKNLAAYQNRGGESTRCGPATPAGVRKAGRGKRSLLFRSGCPGNRWSWRETRSFPDAGHGLTGSCSGRFLEARPEWWHSKPGDVDVAMRVPAGGGAQA
jgi:hypothetical protein